MDTAIIHFMDVVNKTILIGTVEKKKSKLLAAFIQAAETSSETLRNLPNKTPGIKPVISDIKKLINTYQGIINGLEESTLSLTDLRLTVAQSQTYLDSIEGAFNAIPQDPKEDTPDTILHDQIAKAFGVDYQSHQSLKDAVKEIEDALTKRPVLPDLIPEDPSKEQLRKYLEGVKSLRSTLPATLDGKPFTVVKLPIVPVFASIDRKLGEQEHGRSTAMRGQPYTQPTFKSAGINTITLTEYTLVENQILMVVSKKKAKENISAKDKALLPKEGRVSPLGSNSSKYIVSYADKLLDIVEDTLGSYSVVSEVAITNPRNTDTALVWIMPTKKMGVLIARRLPKITAWGLPF